MTYVRTAGKILLLLIMVGVIPAIIAGAIFADHLPAWTGLGSFTPPQTVNGFQRAKTLWDWMTLLLVPGGLVMVAYWLNRLEKRREEQRTQDMIVLEERRSKDLLTLEDQRAQEATLQAYLEAMTHLLLENDLRHSNADDEVRTVARARTLTVLRVLNAVRKASVIQFLYESRLIHCKDTIVDLSGADLTGLELPTGTFTDANLRKTNLRRANLQSINLARADLTQAALQGANLRDAVVGDVIFNHTLYSHRTQWPDNFDPNSAFRGHVHDVLI